ncbi:NACHT, LRR and PYD domains-containing protein 3-like [Gopherus evgoodei]|uniref:NACHT, LRR and PYD domains-containing protein 3-like n=1 Tax=Gopherus evgoodei TaxID=1825980 RepID=UPI0011CFC8E5|nr:NACHT, LRR and PYD domains-containing protein 3-like [Gopherus evgoodei]
MENRSKISDLLQSALDNLLQEDFKRFKDKLSHFDFEEKGTIPRGQLENADRTDTKNLLMKFYGGDAAVNVTIDVFTQINLRDSAAKLREEREKDLHLNQKQSEASAEDFRVKYREYVQKKYQVIKDRNAHLGENVKLNSRYTKLIIVDSHGYEKNREHEIIATGWKHTEAMTERASSVITMGTLFKPYKDGQTPQIVVLVGAAGIGKTITSKKIMLDWAAGELYKEMFDYVFYINCREMNLLTKEVSVADMILKHCPNNKTSINHILGQSDKLLFIIDGFDELRFSFDQSEDNLCSEPWEKKPVEIILSSLFRKTVLPESYLLITTRPAALEKLGRCERYAEILGFSEADRKEYFHKFFGNEKQARQAYRFVRENEILFTMCFVPIMCWIICTVLKQQLEKGEDLAQASKTTTGMYVLYLSSLVNPPGSNSKPCKKASLRGLCSLSADGIWKQKILFEEEEIKMLGLDQAGALPLFLNENIFQKDIDTECLYSFIHLSFQEFFAALFYVLEEDETMEDSGTPKKDVKTLLENYGNSRNYLMLTVRFLYGLLNEKSIKDMEEKFGCKISPKIKLDLIKWIQTYKQTVLSVPSVYDKIICQLEEFRCLYEIQDENFMKNALEPFTKIVICRNNLTPMDQIVLSFCVSNCHRLVSLEMYACTFRFEDRKKEVPQRHEELDHLRSCKLTADCCGDLSSVLSTNQFLTDLDLTANEVRNTGVQLLREGLKHQNCKLQRLSLKSCNISDDDCTDLAAALRTSQSLTELDLNFNHYLRDSVVQLLCEGLIQPTCKLQSLKLNYCNITHVSCKDLAAVLKTSQRLIELDMGTNELQEAGVQLLCEALKHPNCRLQRLGLGLCRLTAACCGDLSSALSTSQTLVELNLQDNRLEDSGVQLPCEALKHPNCKLQKIKLRDCHLTDVCCGDLSSFLSTSQTLSELNLKHNKLEDSGVQLLCEGLKHPRCKLQKLKLANCDLTAACCGDLSSVLSTRQTLTELDLRNNKLEDSGMRLLCEGLKHPNCKLQNLRLSRVISQLLVVGSSFLLLVQTGP